MMIAVGARRRTLPLVAGGVSAGLALGLLLAANRAIVPDAARDVAPLALAFALAALVGVAKTTTV